MSDTSEGGSHRLQSQSDGLRDRPRPSASGRDLRPSEPWHYPGDYFHSHLGQACVWSPLHIFLALWAPGCHRSSRPQPPSLSYWPAPPSYEGTFFCPDLPRPPCPAVRDRALDNDSFQSPCTPYPPPPLPPTPHLPCIRLFVVVIPPATRPSGPGFLFTGFPRGVLGLTRAIPAGLGKGVPLRTDTPVGPQSTSSHCPGQAASASDQDTQRSLVRVAGWSQDLGPLMAEL